MNDYCERIKNYINDEIKIMQALDVIEINKAINALEKTRIDKTTVYICGNGGSGATASHFTGDFNRGVSDMYEDKYNFVCLNDNIPTIMAIANDYSYTDIFRRQLQGRIGKGDVLIVLSGSGNSANVVEAAEYAKKCGTTIIGITGYSGGRVKELSDISLHVPIDDMQITEDVHLMFDHLMMHVLTSS